MHIDKKYLECIEEITKTLLQNLYVLQPQLEFVLFLKRGEVESLDEIDDVYRLLRQHFEEFKVADKSVLQNLIGISEKSKVFYSLKSYVNAKLQIRMAMEEDHDDLAEIFNKQS